MLVFYFLFAKGITVCLSKNLTTNQLSIIYSFKVRIIEAENVFDPNVPAVCGVAGPDHREGWRDFCPTFRLFNIMNLRIVF